MASPTQGQGLSIPAARGRKGQPGPTGLFPGGPCPLLERAVTVGRHKLGNEREGTILICIEILLKEEKVPV